MTTVSLEDAKTRLPELFDAASRGETVLISKGQNQSVQLVPRAISAGPRQFGSARGLLNSAADFNAPLNDFREYEQ